ncbi:unnamed protein product [Zymoseptoria tritici ST99CH_1A5]|uniref:ABM domain-containing protein n=2 Tax=Zymoseptoria tritici TaxID=1047171 RepID=A0A2H1GNU3_ZYMTR|nr:unnamed protein product [Zymoseptoria tritici ST99CH_1E4]SMR57636.1 unnamed protein product [Zymoseptoria tritici ST99CH_3D1]SMY26074.1 unnamed protein product [Zymoseptoria tritici ST99CH_1A5]
MSEVNIVAILHPAQGKSDRVKELLQGMCKDVHQKEDYTLRYIATEQIGAEGTPDIVMIETYKSKEAADKHTQEPHFKELFATMEKEGLMAKAPYLAQTVSKAGFDLDRKLIG